AVVPPRVGEDARRPLGPGHGRKRRQVGEDQRVGEAALLQVARPGGDAALRVQAEQAAQEVQPVLGVVAEVPRRHRLAPAHAVQVRLLEADVLEAPVGEVCLGLLDGLHGRSSEQCWWDGGRAYVPAAARASGGSSASRATRRPITYTTGMTAR